MATRGVKFNFQPGEVVLCFEPDQTKARVLYDAKILDVTSSKDRKGRRRPEYHIHFQGWNSSWDRIVPASFVLKNSTENRQLMKRVAALARTVWDCVVPESLVLKSNAANRALMRQLADVVKFTKRNKSRKRRIDHILKQHFRTMPRFDSDTDTSDTDDEDDDEDEDEDPEDEEIEEEMEEQEEEEEHEDEDEEEEANSVKGKMRVEELETTEEEESTDEELEGKENGVPEGPVTVTLDIPGTLKRKLEDDCYFINRKHKLVNLPAEPNVITILEGYVKHFAVNVLCSTVDKYRPRHWDNQPPEKNISVCKEVVDGLRVFFDFTLSTILLYNCERTQYTKICATFKPVVTTVKEQVSDSSEAENMPRSPRLRSAGRHSPAAAAEPSPKIPRLSPKNLKQEQDETSEDELPARRMTRHSYQEEIKRSRGSSESKSDSKTIPSGKTKKRHSSGGPGSGSETKVRRDSLRSSGRGPCMSSQTSCTDSQKSTSLSERVTPPPPLLIPSGISSQASSSPRHTPTYRSRCSTPTLSEHIMTAAERDGALNRVMIWKLIPDEVATQTPPYPSVIYGAHHLLRLFVKLPDLLSEMRIPQTHRQPLVKHLGMFLDYLVDRREELMPESSYIDMPDNYSGTKQQSSKH